MKFEKFVEEIAKHYNCEAKEIEKNDEKLKAVEIITDSCCHPVMYFYPEMTEEDIPKVLESIKDSIDKAPKEDDVNKYATWEYVKEHLRPCLCGKRKVKASALTRDKLNLTQYLRVIFDNGSYNGSYVVEKSHILHWGVPQDEIFKIAEQNAEKDYMARYMIEEIAEITGTPLDVMKAQSQGRWKERVVASTVDMMYGASVMFSDATLKKIAELLETDVFYILPSSVHAIICVPANDDIDAFTEIARNVNKNVVLDKDVLSDNVYICKDGVVSVG